MSEGWDYSRRYFADPEENHAFGLAVQRLAASPNAEHADTVVPGAMLILGMICGRTDGNFLLTMAYYKIIELRGWIGPRLWEVWKDECNQDFGRFLARLLE